MGLFSFLGLGGGSTTVNTTQAAQNTTNVDVQSSITNVISMEALAEVFDRFFSVFSTNEAAQVDATILAAQATLGASLVNAQAQTQATQQVSSSIARGFLLVGVMVLAGMFLFRKGKRK